MLAVSRRFADAGFIGHLIDAPLFASVSGEQTFHGPPARTAIAVAILPSRYTAMVKKHTGQCACGAVRFGFDIDPDFVAVCHCLDCKRASGGEALTLLGAAEDDFTLLSGRPKAFHDTAPSGKGLNRKFCPACGARLLTSNAESYPGMVFVTIGSLDNPQGIKPVLEMFTKRRLAWAVPLDVRQFDATPG